MADRESIEVEIGGATFLVGGITPRKCLHIVRRMGPFIGNLTGLLTEIMKDENEANENAIDVGDPTDDGPDTLEEAEALAEIRAAKASRGDEDEDEEDGGKGKLPTTLSPADIMARGVPILTDTFAKMSDTEVDYIVDNLLCGARMKTNGGAIMPLIEGGRLKYPKLALATQLDLARRVFVYNLEAFFDALPSGFKEKALKATSRVVG
jgi:hypothetical protein